ncbi:MAG: cytochrome C [Chitinophagaceae bacterium]|nr:MAG: cytochrome C [Chitinophagaceae bacterium]
MKKLIKYSFFSIGGILAIIIMALTYISYALPNVGAPPDIEVKITAEKVERGRYLALHVMQCIECHAERDFNYFAGPMIEGTEAAGGERFDQSMGFPGVFISPNITPYGIGDWTDGELFRLITTGVKNNGDPIFPVMPYHNYGKLDEDDIRAVIAYLRTIEPIETNHPVSKADFPFNFILRTIPEKAQLSQRPPENNKLAYGQYMFTAAACGDCHTQFEKGSFTGPLAGGGREFGLPDGSILRAPNLTPHETGLKHWTKEDFVNRFKRYDSPDYRPHRVNEGDFQTIMPWITYAGMKTSDIEAIYIFLQSLEPYDNSVEMFTARK